MEFEYCALSDVGRVRDNNEDAVIVDTSRGLMVLADGMGGYNAGEVASAMAAEHIWSALADWRTDAAPALAHEDVEHALKRAVDGANTVIFDAAHRHPAYTGMGTTVVVLVVCADAAIVGHVGDSRAYRWRAGEFAQLTHDHSLLQEQIDLGIAVPGTAFYAASRNLVTRALGVESTVRLDVRACDMAREDVFLLCSDGLNDLVADAEIAAIIASPGALEAKAQALIDLANERGGRDNVSVALMRVAPATRSGGEVLKITGTIEG